MDWTQKLTLTAALTLGASATAEAAPQRGVPSDAPLVETGRLKLVPRDRAPAPAPAEEALERVPDLRAKVEEEPRRREHRLALVRALVDADQLEAAITEAKAWRAMDAYDLVVVRMLGDLYTKAGEAEKALRTYSAVTELLAEDPQAQRALATVLKQGGDLEAALARLVRAAELRPEDARLKFELADIHMRLGNQTQARELLEAIADDDEVSKQIRHPARQRLAQVYGALRREALSSGDESRAQRMADAIDELGLAGGARNDIKVYLSWDTDRTDVDLWVTTPRGEKIFYSHKEGKNGAALYDDVTSGYGPESFSAPKAVAGEYKIQVNYFSGGNSAFREARGEVVVVLDEGADDERVVVLPYEIHHPKQTLDVARIEVKR